MFRVLREGGWTAVICDNALHDNETWWNWFYLFYLSKYYEFIDTFILMWKRKRISFLQKFHHIGAVVGMWILLTTRTHTSYNGMLPNSFIHSFMYFYYTMSVLKIKVPFKWIMTAMQMMQFVGIYLFGFWELYHSQCLRFGDRLAIWYHAVYVMILFLLFAWFWHKTYSKKAKKQ